MKVSTCILVFLLLFFLLLLLVLVLVVFLLQEHWSPIPVIGHFGAILDLDNIADLKSVHVNHNIIR